GAAFRWVPWPAWSAASPSTQRAMAETAAAAGVQIAASGSPGNPSAPYLAGAFQPTQSLMQSVMFGTTIVPGPAGQPCGQVAQDATLEVCVYPDGNLVADTGPARPGLPITSITRY